MKYSALFLLLSTAIVGAAQAQDTYVVASVGQSKFNGGSGIDQPSFDAALNNAGGMVQSSTLSSTDTGFKLLIGQNFNPNFAVEGGYVNLGKANYSASLSDGNATESFKSSGLVVDAVGIVPLSKEFSLTGKVGWYYGQTSSSANNSSALAASAFNGQGSTWNSSLNYGVGLSYAINPAVAIRAEYERFANVGDSAVNGGTSNVDLFSVGISAKF